MEEYSYDNCTVLRMTVHWYEPAWVFSVSGGAVSFHPLI